MTWFDTLKVRLGGAKPNSEGGRSFVFPADMGPAADRGRGRTPTGPQFPRFRSTAGDQVDSKASDRFASVRLRLRGAYTPSQPVADRRMFAGRTEILSTLIRSIEDERLHTIIYGERGIGKTSMLHVLIQAARDARYLVAYAPCSQASTFDETIRAVAADIPLGFHSGFGPTSAEAERGLTFASLLPESPVTVRLASELLARVAGTRVLIVLDEFERCESPEFRRSIAEFLKNLSDRSIRVQIVIAGVAADLAELMDQGPRLQRNLMALAIPKMSNEEIRQLVENGEALSGLTFDERAANFIVAVANGLPYLASLLSQHAGLSAVDEGRLEVSLSDAETAVDQALYELKARMSRKSQAKIAATVRERSLKLLGPLAGLARSGGGQFDLEDVDEQFEDELSVAQARSLLNRLVADGGLIELREDDLGAHYGFVEETVAPYIWLLAAQARFKEAERPPVAAQGAARDPVGS